jgi:hypothetical protein
MSRDDIDNLPPWSLRWWTDLAQLALLLATAFAAVGFVVFGTPIGQAIGTGALFGVVMSPILRWMSRRHRS